MSQQHRSITQRLRRAKSTESKQEAALDWAANWQAEQLGLVKSLEWALAHDDYDALCRVTGHIKAVTDKRFIALPKVIEALTNGKD